MPSRFLIFLCSHAMPSHGHHRFKGMHTPSERWPLSFTSLAKASSCRSASKPQSIASSPSSSFRTIPTRTSCTIFRSLPTRTFASGTSRAMSSIVQSVYDVMTLLLIS